MGKNYSLIQELIRYIERMPEGDKSLFRSSLGKSKSGKEIASMFKSFENSNHQKDLKEQIKRVTSMPNGIDYKTFIRFKKKLFDFEISPQRIKKMKSEDYRTYLLTELKIKSIKAIVLAEKHATSNSVQVLTESYNTAMKSEFLHMAREFSIGLSSCFKYTEQPEFFKKWQVETHRLDSLIPSFQSHLDNFDRIVKEVPCCTLHKSIEDIIEIEKFISQIEKSKLLNVKLMHSIVQIKHSNQSAGEKLSKTLKLREILNNRPDLYPINYYLVVQHMMLDSLWMLKRHRVMLKWAESKFNADQYASYEGLLIVKFYLNLILQHEKFDLLQELIIQIKLNEAFQKFPKFMTYLQFIELHIYLQRKEYRTLLKVLSDNEMKFDQLCETQLFQLKVIQILALSGLNKRLTMVDKFDCLRKTYSRNQFYHSQDYFSIVLEAIKLGIQEEKSEIIIPESFKQPDSNEDLRPVLFNHISTHFTNVSFKFKMSSAVVRMYPVNSFDKLSQVAEPVTEFEYSIHHN